MWIVSGIKSPLIKAEKTTVLAQDDSFDSYIQATHELAFTCNCSGVVTCTSVT